MSDLKQTFGRENRLFKSEEIRDVRFKGKKFFIAPFITYRRNNRLGKPRMAVALAAKVGNSVLRNKIKRLFREFFRKNKLKLGSYDYFFYGNSQVESFNKKERQEILKMLSVCFLNDY